MVVVGDMGRATTIHRLGDVGKMRSRVKSASLIERGDEAL